MQNPITKLTSLFNKKKENNMNILKQKETLEASLNDLTGKHEATLSELSQAESALKLSSDELEKAKATIKELTDKVTASQTENLNLETKVEELKDESKTVNQTAAEVIATQGIEPVSVKEQIKFTANEEIVAKYNEIKDTSEGWVYFQAHKDVLKK